MGKRIIEMTESKITWGPDGNILECTNLIPSSTGMHHVNIPVNAVLVQLVECEDEDGNIYYDRVTSVICADDHMKDALLAEARQIIRERG